MATKKRGLAAFRSRSKRTRKPRPAPRKNPASSVVDDIKVSIAPAVGAYLATRLLSRIVYTLVQRKAPRFGKHASSIAAIAGFAGAWYGAGKIDSLEPYHGPIVAGAGVAAAHTLFTTYVPKYGWIMADPKPADVISAPTKAQVAAQAAEAQAGYMTLEDELEAEAERVANAAIGDTDVVRESLSAPPAASMSRGPAPTASGDEDDDFSDILDDGEIDWGNDAAWSN